MTEEQPREECLLLHVGDEDVVDAGVKVGERVEEEIVRCGPREMHVFDGDAELNCFGGADPDGHDARFALGCVFDRFEHENRRLMGTRDDEREHMKGYHLVPFVGSQLDDADCCSHSSAKRSLCAAGVASRVSVASEEGAGTGDV